MRVKNIKRKSFRRRTFLIAVIMIFMAMPLYVHAADLKILSTVVFDGNIYVYIRGIAQLNQDCEVQIGNTVCGKEQLSFAPLSDAGVSIRTLVLIDNSKSISDESHEDIQEILEGLISSAAENEEFKIGTFSDRISYLCEYTNNKEVLNNVIGTIAYNDQDTYLSDVLYNLMSELRAENTNAYTRVLIFADGADDNAIGFTNDEVRSYIGENVYPVYTVGIPAKNNSSKLEVMFSFSRASGSEYFLLDGSISNADIVNSLLADQEGICLKISPDENLKDGSNKRILLKLNSTAGNAELTTNADMPFGSGVSQTESRNEEEEAGEEEKEEQNIELPVLQPADEVNAKEEDSSFPTVYVLLGALIAVIILAALAAAVITVRKRKKKKKEALPVDESPIKTIASDNIEKTIFSSSGSKKDDARDLWKKKNYLVLKNLDNTNIMMKVQIADRVRIGRREKSDKAGGDIPEILIEDDKEVSRMHCEIILREDLLYIQDCNSLNGTRYQGVAVYGETPIISGGEIEIGAHRYSVELVKQS